MLWQVAFLGAFGILITIIIIVRIEQWFDENILSAQGQLTNMLPVPSWQIVLSKILHCSYLEYYNNGNGNRCYMCCNGRY